MLYIPKVNIIKRWRLVARIINFTLMNLNWIKMKWKKKIYNDIARSCFVIPRKVMQLLYVAVTENIWEHAVRWFVFVIIRLWKKTPFRVVIEKCIKIIMCLSFHIDAKTRVSACCRGIHTMRYVTSFIFVKIPTYGLRTYHTLYTLCI